MSSERCFLRNFVRGLGILGVGIVLIGGGFYGISGVFSQVTDTVREDIQREYPHRVYIDTLDLSVTECGWQKTLSRRAVGGAPLKLRGKTYARGVGHHSPGSIELELPPVPVLFHTIVGIDDETGGLGHAEFVVLADNKIVWRSGFLTGKDESKTCDLSLDGVRRLTLRMDTGPEGYGNDHGDWADAFVAVSGEKEVSRGVKTVAKTHGITDSAGKEIHRMDEVACEFESLIRELRKGIPQRAAEQSLRGEATFLKTDRDPVDVVLRRTAALVSYMETMDNSPNLAAEKQRLASLMKQNGDTPLNDTGGRKSLFEKIVALRKTVSLKNPLLDFTDVLFIKRHFNPEPETQGNHMCDQFFGFHSRPDGGIFILKNAFANDTVKNDTAKNDTVKTVKNVLENSVVESGRLAGTAIDSTFGVLAPELFFDGTKLLFAAADTKNPRHSYTWTTENCYHLFEVNLDGTNLRQLTDGPVDDIDPCYLPNGRIALISERRGGYGRCHGRPVPSYTLHSMNPDGSDMTMLSPHETNEWKPSIDNSGMIIYTRWDYVDRGFNQAHHPWTTFPDGRDARALHGNFSPVQNSRPQFETTIRAIPHSQKLIATAAMHHGQYFGSILLIDPTVEDDGAMSQVRRVTPEQPFPEVENQAHKDGAHYGQPYPLSEDFYLVVYDSFSGMGKGPANNYGLYLLDSFGNKTLLYRDPSISVQCPIPVRTRPVPPVLPHLTLVGKPLAPGEEFVPIPSETLPKTANVGVVNCYQTRYNIPEGTKIQQLRIVQLLPKTNPYAHKPAIGYGDQKGARAILGTVPVEADGSAYFRLPVDIPVYFQALDETGRAVQWMRSATYVKPGEQLVCTGCHENRHTSAITVPKFPLAMQREPSDIQSEGVGTNPFSYPLFVQPIWDKHCVDCHATETAAGKTFLLDRGDLDNHFYRSYENLRKYVFYYDNASWVTAQTQPGTFGADQSKLWQILQKEHYDVDLTEAENRKIRLWLDNNADFYGVYEFDSLPKQRRGEVVKPGLE